MNVFQRVENKIGVFFKNVKRGLRWFKYGFKDDCDWDYECLCNVMMIKMKDLLQEMLDYFDLVELTDRVKSLGKALFYLKYWCNYDEMDLASKLIDEKLGEIQYKKVKVDNGNLIAYDVWHEKENEFTKEEINKIYKDAYNKGNEKEEYLKSKFLEAFKKLKWWWV